MKLFYSYCHQDEQHRVNMEKHLAFLKKDGKLNDWCDKKIEVGAKIFDEIDKNLLDSEIISLLISADFIASPACMKELEIAIKRRDEEGISLVPIILSPCAWKDVLGQTKAIPQDGRAVSSFRNSDEAWHSIYEEIKTIVDKRIRPNIKKEYEDFLEETELASILGKKLTLSDIFIPIDFKKIDLKDKPKDIEFASFMKAYFDIPENIIISGEQQSGKSALLKQIFLKLPSKFIPIYIDCSQGLSGKTVTLVNNHFRKQYLTTYDMDYFHSKKVVLFDDFHFLKTEERKKIIEELKDRKDIKMILTADDIYNLGIKEQILTKIFSHYKIKNMGKMLRDDLTINWMKIIGKDHERETIYRDELNSKIDMVVQKTVVPAYPFFIYTIIAAHEMSRPMDSEITSQGHCYQALIYIALNKVGATDIQIDMYINVLSELAIFIYKHKKEVLSEDDLNSFFAQYLDQYSIGISKDALVANLIKSLILNCSSLKQYSFKYKYIYLYFLGKYFAEHIKDFEDEIENIINNLQVEENGYILIFLIHHTKNPRVLEHIEVNLLCLFDKQKETTLIDSEIEHLNKYVESLKPLVIEKVSDIEKNRKESLERADKLDDDPSKSAAEDNFLSELRRAIKTVEVAGHILRNRTGSLKTSDQKVFLETAMNVFLRITDLFLTQFQRNERDFVEYISYLVDQKFENKSGTVPDKAEIRRIAEQIFYNLNFITCYATIRRVSESICSKELVPIMREVCDKKNTPIGYLIKKQCDLMYKGYINIKDLEDHNVNLSVLVKRLLCTIVIDHCYMHKVEYKERQMIAHALNIKETEVPISVK